MLILSTVNHKIEVVLAGNVTTNQLQCYSAWRERTATTFEAGDTEVLTNNTTDVTLVGSPSGASTQRIVDYLSVFNSDTVAATVTIKMDVSATEKILWKGVLAVGGSVAYAEGRGFLTYNSAGRAESPVATPQCDVQYQVTAGAGVWTKPTTFTPTYV